MNQENKKAFTLIEMVVAVFIIIIAVVGIIEMTSKYVQRTKFEKESYVAALLGQEGVEIVKNIRDNNWINGLSWNNNLSDGNWEVDYDDAVLTSVTPGSERFLYIDSNNYYNYSSGTPSIYKRTITLANNGDKISIIVNVSFRLNQVTVKQDIYNWYNP